MSQRKLQIHGPLPIANWFSFREFSFLLSHCHFYGYSSSCEPIARNLLFRFSFEKPPAIRLLCQPKGDPHVTVTGGTRLSFNSGLISYQTVHETLFFDITIVQQRTHFLSETVHETLSFDNHINGTMFRWDNLFSL